MRIRGTVRTAHVMRRSPNSLFQSLGLGLDRERIENIRTDQLLYFLCSKNLVGWRRSLVGRRPLLLVTRSLDYI